MTQVALILLAIAVGGVVSVVAGVAVLAGAGWALVAAGILAITAAVLLLDPADLRSPRGVGKR
ncbi:hypothetical protein ACWFRF_20810 [Nocardia sp. NPDC055165]